MAAIAGSIFAHGVSFAQPGCRQTTLRSALSQSRQDLFKGALGAIGSGLVLYGVRNGETAVLIGSLALFTKEFADFVRSAQTGTQLKKFDGLDPDTPLQACLATGAIASTLNFESVTVIKPLNPEPPVAPAKSPPDTSPHAAQLPSLPIDRKILDRILDAPSPTLLPQNRASPPAMPARPDTTPSWWSEPAASFEGRVFDGDSGNPIYLAYITLVRLKDAEGATSVALTQGDGSFRFDYIPAGPYVLSVSSPRYSGSSSIVNAPGGIKILLRREPLYPCEFTVFNLTGWTIAVGTDTPVLIPPYGAYTATLDRPSRFFAHADFEDGPPLNWGPISGQCGGRGYIEIAP